MHVDLVGGVSRTDVVDTVDGVDAGNGFLRCFGRQMKLLREAAGLTQAELGAHVGYGEAQVAAVEQGRRIPKPEMVDAVDRVVGGNGVLSAMKEEVGRAQYPGFFRQYAALESQATKLNAYSSQVVKGLLQTEGYARAVFEMWRPILDAETVEQRVAARMDRQKIFSKQPAPLMSFVIDEVVLRRPVGGRAVMRGQLEQLLLLGRDRNIEIQVMPTTCEEHAGLAGAFTLLQIGERRRIAYMEVQGESALRSDPKKVGVLESTYGTLRAQALTPRESLAFIEQLLGEQ